MSRNSEQEISPLPVGWQRMAVDEIKSTAANACVGGPFGSNLTTKDYVDVPGVPVIRGTNLSGNEGRFRDDGFVFVSEKKADTLRQNTAYSNDLIFTQRGTLGQVGHIPLNCRFERSVISQSQMKLTPNAAVANIDYLYFYFSSPEVLRVIENSVEATGVPHITLGILRRFPVTLPPLPQQRKIARILTTLDNVITQTEALIAKYQAIKQGLMHDLFTRGVDATGKLRPPQSEAPELYKQSDLGWIPKEWEVVRLADYLERIEQGWSPDCESEPASAGEWGVLKTTAVVWEGFNCLENKRLPRHLPPLPQYEVRVDDVLMTRGGPNSRVGVVAHVQKTTDKLMLSDKIYRLIPKKGLQPRYLALALTSGKTQTHLSTLKTGLAESQTNISQQIVRRLWVGLPQLTEQNAICQIIKVAENVLAAERRSLEAFRVNKTGLMQDLLTGKVPVKTDEAGKGGMKNDE